MKRILSILVCVVIGLSAWSQYMIEIKPTKKILHVDQLGMSSSATVLEVLQTMPEMLTRASADGTYLSNYSIQVDGKDVGQSRDVVLDQTVLAEVDVIEISTSPTVSEQKNGAGGVINIKLKPIDQNGTSGLVMLDASTSWDVQPSVLVNYKTDKFLLRSSVRAEYYRPTDNGYSISEEPGQTIESYDTAHASYKQETAKLYMVYSPTNRDELKVNIWESYSRQHASSVAEYTYFNHQHDNLYTKDIFPETGQSFSQGLTAEAFIGYNHKYAEGKGELVLEAQYSYMPIESIDSSLFKGSKTTFGGDVFKRHYSVSRQHSVTAEAASKHILLNKAIDLLDLKYGMNAAYYFGNSYMDNVEKNYNQPAQYDTISNTNPKIYASPYLELNYKHTIWELQVGARYQYYRVNQHDMSQGLAYVDDHTFTGNVSLQCQVATNHHLRLMMARNIQREVETDKINILPYYNADLNYIFNWTDGGNDVLLSAGANYIYAKQLTAGYTGTACVNAQLIYKYKILSLAFAGNMYLRKLYGVPDAGNRYFYYNLSLLPVLSFRHQWILSARLQYNSKVQSPTADLGDCVYAQIRLSKDIKNWNIHIEMDDIFGYATYNTFYYAGSSFTDIEDLYKRCLTIGFSYKF